MCENRLYFSISVEVHAIYRLQIARYKTRYEELVSLGRAQNEKTQWEGEDGIIEPAGKIQQNHLLFLYDFRFSFSNNMSEKDLRINRQKMTGRFRAATRKEMYCNITSFIETIKRRKRNLFQSIIALMNGAPVCK